MSRSSKYLWLKVSADRFEFPILIANTAKELAEMMGVNISTVKVQEMNYRKKIRKNVNEKYRIVKVENIYEDGDEDESL